MYMKLVCCASLLVGVSLAQQCYFPDGTAADRSWTPCNAASRVSHCCREGDACLDNGYCFNQKQSAGFANRLARGACTDKNWSSANCPAYCRTISPSGQQSIALVSDQENGNFCCGLGTNFYNNSKCTSDSRPGDSTPFTLQDPSFIIDRKTGSTSLADAAAASSGQATVTTTIAAQTVTVTATMKSSSDKQAIAAGVGAAVPLGCLLIAALIFVFLLRRQNKRLKNEGEAQQQRFEEEKRGLGIASSQQGWSTYKAPPPMNVVELENTRRPSELDGARW